MKRSKIFLGVSACLLGIVAFAASKTKWNQTTVAYTTGSSPHTCFQLSGQRAATTASGTTRLEDASNHLLYTSTCVEPVYQGN
jgi:hypothetical protein